MKKVKERFNERTDYQIVATTFLIALSGILLTIIIIGNNITSGNLGGLTTIFSIGMSIISLLSIVAILIRVKWSRLLSIQTFDILLHSGLIMVNSFAALELMTKGWIPCLC
ncbi:MAG: hypothetical protein AAF391_13885 [Bacteroidota bacterium]